MGSQELIKGQVRYCLWIKDEDVDEARSIPLINERLLAVSKSREESDAESTRAFAARPHRFVQISYEEANSIIVPRVSSEKREYLPIGFLTSETVVNDLAFAVYSPEPFLFGVISSKMHIAWVRAIAGGLETRIRYSNSICYNNFPIPKLTQSQKDTISSHVWNVISEREKFPEKNLADLYDPDTMPEGLRAAHRQLDASVEQCYRSRPFSSDEERLEYLFKLYEEMTGERQPKNAQNGTQNTMLTVLGPLLDTEDVLPLGE